MPWGKMDDKFHRNRKVRALLRERYGREALGMWTYWWSWCLDDQELTGIVPSDELDRQDLKLADLLIKVGLWDVVDAGYRFHDFEKYNPTAAKLEAKRASDRARQAALRERDRTTVEGRIEDVSRRDIDATRERVDFDSDVDSGVVEIDSKSGHESVASPRAYAGARARAPLPSQPIPSRSEPPTQPDEGESGRRFGSKDLIQLFSRLRKAAGGGFYEQKMSDYDALQAAVAWARAERPDDPAGVCEQSIGHYLEQRGAWCSGWPLTIWAKDPGRWLASTASSGGAGPVSTDFDERDPEWMTNAG